MLDLTLSPPQEIKFQFASEYSDQPLLQKMLGDIGTPDDYRYPSSVGGCFVAGTLVWTHAGLISIEQIKVGDRVLSQPDSTGERAYRRVVRTITHEDKIIVSVRYQAADNFDLNVLHATGNHPFWVEGIGWTAAEKLVAGQQLQLADGTLVYVVEVGPVYKTDRRTVGWEPEFYDHVCEGVEGDFSHGWKRVGGDGDYYDTRKPAEAFSADPYLKVQVYNIEVEGFHTYYVGTTGVWVHNADCSNVELWTAGNGKEPPAATSRYQTETELADSITADSRGYAVIPSPTQTLATDANRNPLSVSKLENSSRFSYIGDAQADSRACLQRVNTPPGGRPR